MRTLYASSTPVLTKTNDVPTRLPFCDLFPADLQLAWNTEARILSLLRIYEPCIIGQQQFTRNEWLLLMSLIQSYPDYAPHEILLSELTLLSCDEWRERLQEIRQEQPENLIRELKPVYRALSSVRTKLKKLYPQLKISPVRNIGYVFSLSSEDPH